MKPRALIDPGSSAFMARLPRRCGRGFRHPSTSRRPSTATPTQALCYLTLQQMWDKLGAASMPHLGRAYRGTAAVDNRVFLSKSLRKNDMRFMM